MFLGRAILPADWLSSQSMRVQGQRPRLPPRLMGVKNYLLQDSQAGGGGGWLTKTKGELDAPLEVEAGEMTYARRDSADA